MSLEALKAIGHVPAVSAAAGVVLDGVATTPIAAGELVPLANGLLDLDSRKLRPHTPEFFCAHVLPSRTTRTHRSPTRWLQFLDELWGDDEESKATLGEWFGYVLSGDTAQQKMWLLVGPKRSGKGTIARVLTGLLGVHNGARRRSRASPRTSDCSPWSESSLAVISDARLGRRADSTIAVERLLSISGEDTITVDRKYRDPWTGSCRPGS